MWIIILLFVDMALTATQLHDMRPLSRHWPLKSKVRDLVRRLGCARRGCRAGTRAPKRAVIFVYKEPVRVRGDQSKKYKLFRKRK